MYSSLNFFQHVKKVKKERVAVFIPQRFRVQSHPIPVADVKEDKTYLKNKEQKDIESEIMLDSIDGSQVDN